MRPLISQQNVDAPSTDFPYGRIRNNPGNATGTPFDEALYGDIQQFFARLMFLSGLTPNGIADGNYAGWQLMDALRLAALPYRSYVINLIQTASSNPVVTIFYNQIGTINVVRTATGTYTMTKVGAFPFTQTAIFNATTVIGVIKITHTSVDVLTISTFAGGIPADDVLDNISVEIRVYQ